MDVVDLCFGLLLSASGTVEVVPEESPTRLFVNAIGSNLIALSLRRLLKHRFQTSTMSCKHKSKVDL